MTLARRLGDDRRAPRNVPAVVHPPSGTVTFLFTDVEGSTRLLHELGEEAYAGALAEHRRVVRSACAAEGGVEVDTQGDAFFFAFASALGAVAAAEAMTGVLAPGAIQLRIGLHTGVPLVTDEGYVGDDVHRKATRCIRMEEGVRYEAAATVLIDVAVGEPVVSPGYLHVPDETAMRIHWRHRRDELDAAFERFLFGSPPYRHGE